MTGERIFIYAIKLLGYEDSDDVKAKALPIMNNVYAEVFFEEQGKAAEFEPLKALNDELNVSGYAVSNCILYGVCAALALDEGDSDNQNYYGALFNERLRRLPRQNITKRTNILGMPDGGVV